MIRYVIISTLIHVLLIILTFGLPRLFLFDKFKSDTNAPSLKVFLNNYKLDNINSQKKRSFSDNSQIARVQESEVAFDAKKEDLLSKAENISSKNEEYLGNNQNSSLVPPRVIYAPNIDYPLSAKLRKIQGSVVLSITILTNGRVANIRIVSSSGSELLDASAERFVRDVVFEPAKDEKGNPITVETTYIVHFVLR